LRLPISYEANSVGYYIYTVAGPRVTVDYYACVVDSAFDANLFGNNTFTTTPPLNFTRRETFGYALNGRQFIVPKGETYATIEDRFAATSARVLSGINRSPATDGADRPLVMEVNAGWAHRGRRVASDVLTLWGMEVGLGGEFTYPYTLAMSYRPEALGPTTLADGWFGLAAQDDAGNWVNAVDLNSTGEKDFVFGPWDPAYAAELGTYGIDVASQTAWAVVNHNGDFAVAPFADALPRAQ
jgi:hypothetical protein